MEGLGKLELATVATTASERFEDPRRLRVTPAGGVAVDPSLLEEASRLSGVADPNEVVKRALSEYVERQRFLQWVAAHEQSERSS